MESSRQDADSTQVSPAWMRKSVTEIRQAVKSIQDAYTVE
jgi:hypothetical protein